VTLTTLGYGDITPLTRVGGSFATMEAVVGQLYLTILVARLVGMHISQRSEE
jgi:voltage-gated potassium channel Kch